MKPIGPYSVYRTAGSFVFLSGQIFPDGRGIKEQAQGALENIKKILSELNLAMSDIVKATVFLKDMNHYSDFNDVYSSYFDGPFPARSAVEVSRLPKDVLVEIEVIAFRK